MAVNIFLKGFYQGGIRLSSVPLCIKLREIIGKGCPFKLFQTAGNHKFWHSVFNLTELIS